MKKIKLTRIKRSVNNIKRRKIYESLKENEGNDMKQEHKDTYRYLEMKVTESLDNHGIKHKISKPNAEDYDKINHIFSLTLYINDSIVIYKVSIYDAILPGYLIHRIRKTEGI
jgi:hypothetical protein